MKNTVAIILAAGEGTRFKSEKPKVLHKVLGKSIIERVIKIVDNGFDKKIIVVGHKSELVKKNISDKNIVFVEQIVQLGSGDAVKRAESILKNFTGDLVILSGDVPLLKKETVGKLLSVHKKEKAVATVITCEMENPSHYGRIVRNADGTVKAIVESKDASDDIKKIKEINSGIYVFSSKELFSALHKIKNDNSKGEYYLTDVISILSRKNKKVIAYKTGDFKEIMGINNRCELAEAENYMREKVLENLMHSGVTIVNPATVYVEETVEIEKDATIMPSTIIKGRTKIRSGCVLGPFSYIEDCTVGKNVEIRASFVYGTEIADDVKIGPFSHIRKETKIGSHSRIGNFSEIKKSSIGENTKVSHLSYIGDSHLGKNINIGAGTITCNYDGKNKHKTEIGDDTFVGSNTNLVAPVKIGRGVLIAAGSTITHNVPDNKLAIARGRQIIKKRKDRIKR
ncbi:MAG: bifunctional UDP-N-acetylglucosamine diphosphorylase/glucosamine-1-phosphate N-acetyltransferase GlmU [Elusimicrobia bacterium HGW-Elusimicrobia-4]|nr:MAG: bifunctional UDP-N-acetylglucosamine diphosphorylase/glucosamine-1-phosphate N-acetyltransferase GlmU [Elusimicrobia bacterium HGW-Elusimicrobia-4]